MSTKLEIRDGDPHWWNSPDIWVVPGSDPNGSPGQPIAGESSFLWARVHNTGDQVATGARVDFYWSNPATGVLRSNSTMIGSAFVDLNPGETKEVLCVIPWIPVVVNNGHECVVAEAIHPNDPLPSPLPDAFDPPAYHQVAQRNLNVLAMKKSMMIKTFQVAAPARKEKQLLITMEVGGEIDKQVLKQIGLANHRPAKLGVLKAGFSLDSSCDESGKEGFKKEMKLSVKSGTTKAVYLKILPPDIQPKTYVLLHVISRSDKKVEGGITYVLIKKEEE